MGSEVLTKVVLGKLLSLSPHETAVTAWPWLLLVTPLSNQFPTARRGSW